MVNHSPMATVSSIASGIKKVTVRKNFISANAAAGFSEVECYGPEDQLPQSLAENCRTHGGAIVTRWSDVENTIRSMSSRRSTKDCIYHTSECDIIITSPAPQGKGKAGSRTISFTCSGRWRFEIEVEYL